MDSLNNKNQQQEGLINRVKSLLQGTIFFAVAQKILRLWFKLRNYKSSRRRLKDVEASLSAMRRSNETNFDDIMNFLFRMHPITHDPEISIETEFPVALDSPDHLFPSGTVNDNTRKPRFVKTCVNHFDRNVSYLDLGCAGGGLVRNFLEQGNLSVGVEGSDTSLNSLRAEWARIPFHLFTADITKPFSLKNSNGKPLKFDVVGAWEVMEHLPESTIDQVLENIRNHLAPGGIFTASVATFYIKNSNHHQCVHNEEWWHEKFKSKRLYPKIDQEIFTLEDFPRGASEHDWLPSQGLGFHIVCSGEE